MDYLPTSLIGCQLLKSYALQQVALGGVVFKATAARLCEWPFMARHPLLLLLLLLLLPLLLLFCWLCCVAQGKRPSQYGQPLQQLESWARSRWPAAGDRLYAWSYQVSDLRIAACAKQDYSHYFSSQYGRETGGDMMLWAESICMLRGSAELFRTKCRATVQQPC
jgi:hypothetical protein